MKQIKASKSSLVHKLSGIRNLLKKFDKTLMNITKNGYTEKLLNDCMQKPKRYQTLANEMGKDPTVIFKDGNINKLIDGENCLSINYEDLYSKDLVQTETISLKLGKVLAILNNNLDQLDDIKNNANTMPKQVEELKNDVFKKPVFVERCLDLFKKNNIDVTKFLGNPVCNWIGENQPQTHDRKKFVYFPIAHRTFTKEWLDSYHGTSLDCLGKVIKEGLQVTNGNDIYSSPLFDYSMKYCKSFYTGSFSYLIILHLKQKVKTFNKQGVTVLFNKLPFYKGYDEKSIEWFTKNTKFIEICGIIIKENPIDIRMCELNYPEAWFVFPKWNFNYPIKCIRCNTYIPVENYESVYHPCKSLLSTLELHFPIDNKHIVFCYGLMV